ncbi:MAG TPA: sulfoxide reductase heme-binding subunit YedZ [Sedimenticola sp.]|nr:sulfoxide reductase heme-binding subunit YedZ [Sedimenticola sp.]
MMRFIKPALFLACLAPFVWLVWRAAAGGLGANPIEAVTRFTGDWALRLLLLTLAVTPLRRITGWHALIRQRRMLGLFSFFYASLHFLTYALLDQGLSLAAIGEDILKRPYITLGFLVFLMLVPLAATSSNAMIKRLGGRRWRRLHRLVYLCGIGGVLHYLWLVKADVREPLIYLGVLLLLFALRLPWGRPHGAKT